VDSFAFGISNKSGAKRKRGDTIHDPHVGEERRTKEEEEEE